MERRAAGALEALGEGSMGTAQEQAVTGRGVPGVLKHVGQTLAFPDVGNEPIWSNLKERGVWEAGSWGPMASAVCAWCLPLFFEEGRVVLSAQSCR